MARWATPDAAIREAVMASPLRARGIDYGRVPTTGDGVAVTLDAHSRVLGILGQYDERTQQVLVGWALGLGYERISRMMQEADMPNTSPRTLKRIHRPAWDEVRCRMRELGLIDG